MYDFVGLVSIKPWRTGTKFAVPQGTTPFVSQFSKAGTIRASSSSVPVPARTSKKGVGTFYFGNNNNALADLQMSWYYTWSASPNHAGVNSSAPEFVPMIWCIDEFNDKHNENRNISDELARVPASAEFLLGFNEPDLAEQSNIPDPFKAIEQWPRLAKTGKKLGSPATSKRATEPGGWMETFMNEAARRERTDPNYRVDFVCVHWYPDPNDNLDVYDPNIGELAAEKLEKYINDTYDKYHKQIWLTEFALIDYNHGPNDIRFPTEQSQIAFARAAVYRLERNNNVDRYAWWCLPTPPLARCNNQLYAYSGTRTNVGTAYLYAS